MPFSYACFISYRHSSPLEVRFAERLHRALDTELPARIPLKAYRDDRGLRSGDFIDPAIGRALYESVCLVLVYTRQYFDLEKTYCAREYYAMQQLENERLRHLSGSNGPHGLIIPIILNSEECVPAVVRQRKYYDFHKYGLWRREIFNDSVYGPIIREIAKDVANRYDEFKRCGVDVCSDAPAYELPDENAVRPWLIQIIEAGIRPQLPLRTGGQ